MSAKLWWVSVGGNKSEPARVVDDKTVFTIGCPDGIELSDGTVELVEEFVGAPPLNKKDEAAYQKRWDRKVKRDVARGIYHGYRSFD